MNNYKLTGRSYSGGAFTFEEAKIEAERVAKPRGPIYIWKLEGIVTNERDPKFIPHIALEECPWCSFHTHKNDCPFHATEKRREG